MGDGNKATSRYVANLSRWKRICWWFKLRRVGVHVWWHSFYGKRVLAPRVRRRLEEFGIAPTLLYVTSMNVMMSAEVGEGEASLAGSLYVEGDGWRMYYIPAVEGNAETSEHRELWTGIDWFAKRVVEDRAVHGRSTAGP